MSSDSLAIMDNSTMAESPTLRDDGILVVRNLTKEFGGLTAVDDLSFSVQEKEIMGFIGPNGAGKSTTFNCIMGVYNPTSGTVWYRGEDVTSLSGDKIVKRGMSRTFQEFAPLNDRTVVENVALSLVPDKLISLQGLQGETKQMAAEICQSVGLDDDLHKLPNELPHAGMLRLELGRAIASDPDFVLVDEPFAGLSPNEVDEIAKLIRSLRDHGMTFIVIDHNMHGLLNLIDRAIVIQFGSKIAEGTPEEIRNDPKVQKAYLGSDAYE